MDVGGCRRGKMQSGEKINELSLLIFISRYVLFISRPRAVLKDQRFFFLHDVYL